MMPLPCLRNAASRRPDAPSLHHLLTLSFLVILGGTATVAAAALEVPASRDLGIVKVGPRVLVGVPLHNPDNNDVAVRVSVVGEGFSGAGDTVLLPGRARAEAAVVFQAPAVGRYEGTLTLQVDKLFGTETHTVDLSATAERPRLWLDATAEQGLTMGSTPLGTSVRRSLEIANRGQVSLVLDSLSIRGGDGALTVVEGFVSELAAGETRTVTVQFAPRHGGAHAGELLFRSTDLQPPIVVVPVQAQGLAPALALSPLPEVGVEFGLVEVGRSQVERVTLINRGLAALELQAVEVTGGGFSAAATDSLVPIGPGERRDLNVTFAPRYEGPAAGVLRLVSADPASPEVEMPLQGSARISPSLVEILNPTTITFGSVPIGRTSREHLLLWNRGGSPVTVGLQLQGSLGEFQLQSSSVLLQPGQSDKVELAFSPGEVGNRDAELAVTTESGTHSYRLQGTGKYLQLSPSTWDFDRVPVGESSSAVVDLANLGNADFTVSRIISTGDDFTVYTQVSPDNKYVMPANSLRTLPLNLTFAPTARGLSSATLRVEGFWEEGTEHFEILLNGTGVAAEIELHPSGPIDFGHVVLGETQARALVATNTGDTALRVDTNPLTKEVRVDPAAFALEPGESTQLQVYFTPAALGDRFGQVLLVSNDVRDKAQPVKIVGKGALESIDLTRITRVQASRKSVIQRQPVDWNNTPVVLLDGTKIDLVFDLPDSLRRALVGRRIAVEWVQLDDNYDPKGGSKQIEVQIYGDSEGSVLAENFNLRLKEDGIRRVRLRITTHSYPGAPPQTISQIFEAGGWKWEFEAKPLVSFLTVRPGRTYTDSDGKRVVGKTERLIGLPGIAFVGWHNSENPSVSGVHFTAIGNVLEALSSGNAIAVSLGVAVSLYKDRLLIGFGYDIYDSRPKAKRKGTQDYVMTFKYSGLF